MSDYSSQKFVRKNIDAFQQDAHTWGLSTGIAWIIAAIPFLIVIAMTALMRLPDLFVWVTAEDSLLEWLQFLLVFASSLIFARLSMQFFRRRQARIGILCLMLALGTFFVAGEEIAWGQQIFGWSTPEALEAVNVQQETTLHNISSAHTIFVYAAMLAGLYGTVIPIVRSLRWKTDLPSHLRYLLIPPVCLIPAFFMPFAYRFSRLFLGVDGLLPRFIFQITKFSEVTELCLYFGLFIFAWLNLRQLQLAHRMGTERLTSENKFDLEEQSH